MKLLTKMALLAFVGMVAPTLSVSTARADGCYICAGGSAPHCKDYCRYSGPDTFDARKTCERKGCKIGGTASCPTAVNYKVCSAPTQSTQNGQAVATIAGCAPPAGAS